MIWVRKSNRHLLALTAVLLSAYLLLGVAWTSAEAFTPTVTVQDSTAAVGQTVSVPIVLSDAMTGVAGYDLVVTLSNPNVANILGAEFPEFGLTAQDLLSSSEIRLRAVDLMNIIESGATNVTLETLILEGVKKGNTQVKLSLSTLDDDTGFPIGVEVVPGNLSVKKSTGNGGNGNRGKGRKK